jgi:hypothetical protein
MNSEGRDANRAHFLFGWKDDKGLHIILARQGERPRTGGEVIYRDFGRDLDREARVARGIPG